MSQKRRFSSNKGPRTFKPIKREVSATPFTIKIDSLSDDGRGVGRHQGKVVFVENALIGEEVRAQLVKSYKRYDEARCLDILSPSVERTDPSCQYYAECGGCDVQHLSYQAQLTFKVQKIEQLVSDLNLDDLNIDRNVVSDEVLMSPPTGYRHRARFSVNAKGDLFQLGFKRSESHRVIDVEYCPILSKELNDSLPIIRNSITSLKNRSQIKEVSVCIDDDKRLGVQLMIKNELPNADIKALQQFSEHTNCRVEVIRSAKVHDEMQWYSDSKPFVYKYANTEQFYYYDLGDFTQVNRVVNEQLVARVIELFDLNPGDRIADFYCGVGNFSLPIAEHVASVTGYEWSNAMVEKAKSNAASAKLTNACFESADLSKGVPAGLPDINKVLLDPPRAGAEMVCKQLGQTRVTHCVYVSCNPVTFQRDAGLLLNLGFSMKTVQLADMFPQTRHCELVGLFGR